MNKEVEQSGVKIKDIMKRMIKYASLIFIIFFLAITVVDKCTHEVIKVFTMLCASFTFIYLYKLFCIKEET